MPNKAYYTLFMGHSQLVNCTTKFEIVLWFTVNKRDPDSFRKFPGFLLFYFLPLGLSHVTVDLCVSVIFSIPKHTSTLYMSSKHPQPRDRCVSWKVSLLQSITWDWSMTPIFRQFALASDCEIWNLKWFLFHPHGTFSQHSITHNVHLKISCLKEHRGQNTANFYFSSDI